MGWYYKITFCLNIKNRKHKKLVLNSVSEFKQYSFWVLLEITSNSVNKLLVCLKINFKWVTAKVINIKIEEKWACTIKYTL